jgi:putative ABC transport system substrate-binding protein
MNRRDCLRLLAGTCIAYAPGSRGDAAYRIAWLSRSPRQGSGIAVEHFRDGLADFGYVVGRNLDIEEQWGDDTKATADAAAAAIIASRPRLIAVQGPALFSLRNVPATIPVVFGFSGDPIEAGFAKSVSAPGGNFTGVSFLAVDLIPKRLELLRQLLPRLQRLAVIASPDHPGDRSELAATRTMTDALGIKVSYHTLRNDGELQPALTGVLNAGAEAIIVHPNTGILRYAKAIASFSREHRIPAISAWGEFAERGNLFSYGPKLEEGYRRLAYFADRILRGANPAELPIELPRTVEFVINSEAATALGIVLPRQLLARADRIVK